LDTTTATRYKLVRKVKDKKHFDIELLHDFDLYLQIGDRDFQLAVVNAKENRVLIVEDFILAKYRDLSDKISILEGIFDSHHFLMAGFWKNVKVSFKNNLFSLVPSHLFEENASREYLKLNTAMHPDRDEYLYYKLVHSEAVCAFAVDVEMLNWLKGLYPNVPLQIIHQSASIIEGALRYFRNQQAEYIFAFIDRFKLHITVTDSGKLKYYNQFIVNEASDYYKYLKMVMKEFKVQEDSDHLYVWGFAGRKSPYYTSLKNSFTNLNLGTRQNHLKFSYIFDEMPDQLYFDLFSMHLCE